MSHPISRHSMFVSASLLLLAAIASAQVPAPTYQGRLDAEAGPADGLYDFRVGLFAQFAGGTALQTLTYSDVQVTDGLFSIPLGFDLGVWGDGISRYLNIEVRPTGGVFVTLSPRQLIAPTPLALRALSLPGIQPFVGLVADQIIAPGLTFGGSINIGNRPWQSFTPSRSGHLRAVDANLRPAGQGGVATVKVFEGEGTLGVELRQTSVTVPDGFDGDLRIVIEPPVWVNAGQHYTIRLSDLGGANWRLSDDDQYAGGRSVSAPDRDFGMTTYMEASEGLSVDSPLAIGSSTPVGDLIVGDYQGGTIGSVVAAYAKQAVLGGTYNQPPNSALSVKLLISDYDNDLSVIYPIYAEDENNGVDFYVRNAAGVRTAYFGGQVGVGTTSPDAAMHIVTPGVGSNWQVRLTNSVAIGNQQGGLRVGDTGFVEASSQAQVNGAPFARLANNGLWTVVSDRRMKKDISEADSAALLSAVQRLRPVRYQYKSEADVGDGQVGAHIGMIAQELQKVLPEFVCDGGDLLTVDYAGLSVVAIGAIQEQQRVISRTQADLDAVRAENQELRARLDRIEKMLSSR